VLRGFHNFQQGEGQTVLVVTKVSVGHKFNKSIAPALIVIDRFLSMLWKGNSDNKFCLILLLFTCHSG